MITYQKNLDQISSKGLQGFFVDWPNPPDENTFLRLLKGSYRVVVALDGDKVVGFY